MWFTLSPVSEVVMGGVKGTSWTRAHRLQKNTVTINTFLDQEPAHCGLSPGQIRILFQRVCFNRFRSEKLNFSSDIKYKLTCSGPIGYC